MNQDRDRDLEELILGLTELAREEKLQKLKDTKLEANHHHPHQRIRNIKQQRNHSRQQSNRSVRSNNNNNNKKINFLR
jgi:hypothetical protein